MSDNETSWGPLIGAMMGGGFGYSLVNGFGVEHAIGMAVAFLVLGVGLWAAAQLFGKIRTVIA